MGVEVPFGTQRLLRVLLVPFADLPFLQLQLLELFAASSPAALTQPLLPSLVVELALVLLLAGEVLVSLLSR